MLLTLVMLALGFVVGYLVAGHNYQKAHADSLQFHEHWDAFLEWLKEHGNKD